jgi:hypothetical protein
MNMYRLRIMCDGDLCREVEFSERPWESKIMACCRELAMGWDPNPQGDIFIMKWELTRMGEKPDCLGWGCEHVLTPADHQLLIQQAAEDAGRTDHCGDDPEDHSWEGEGGCDSNPGVWSLGGGAMKYAHVCTECGLRRTEVNLCWQRSDDEPDSVEYTF